MLSIAQLAVTLRRIADARQRWRTEFVVLRPEADVEICLRVGAGGIGARAWTGDSMTGVRLEWLGWRPQTEPRGRTRYVREWWRDTPSEVFVRDLLRTLVGACMTHEGESIALHPWSVSDDGWAGWRWSDNLNSQPNESRDD